MITKMRKQMPNPEMEMEQRFQLCTVTLLHHCLQVIQVITQNRTKKQPHPHPANPQMAEAAESRV
jgi:hypothetical protein